MRARLPINSWQGMCAVPTATGVPPFAVEFQFRNSGAANIFIHQDCGGYNFGVSSCASGFRDRLAEQTGYLCSCDHVPCVGVSDGACPPPDETMIGVGDSLRLPFSGLSSTSTVDPVTALACARSRVLPAGRYRVAIRVSDPEDLLTGLAGRIVTRDFELPAPGGIVDVPLAPSADDVCDTNPEDSAPACTGNEAHEVPCSLTASLSFGWEGGLAFIHDKSTIAAPAVYTRERTFLDPSTPPLACSSAIPRCARDARAVTTGDIVHALALPGIADSFGPDTPVFGFDSRAGDGSVLVLRRNDGTSVALGTPCAACPHPLTPEMATVVSLFDGLSTQMLAAPSCSALRQ